MVSGWRFVWGSARIELEIFGCVTVEQINNAKSAVTWRLVSYVFSSIVRDGDKQHEADTECHY